MATVSRPTVTCARCATARTHYARGLCRPCYRNLQKRQGLDRYELTRIVPQVDRFDWVVVERLMSGQEAVVHPSERDATARELVRRGLPRYNAAELCGMSGKTLRQAVAA